MFTGSRSRRWTAILITAASLGALCGTSAAEPAQSPEQRPKEIGQLIEQLASENPEPKWLVRVRRESVTVFPPAYALHKQNRVFEAADRLVSFGTVAFPQLIEHFDDSRYSFAEPAPNGENDKQFLKRTVGSHCRSIVCSQLDKFDAWGQPMGGFGPTFAGRPEFTTKESMQRWWAKNKDLPLWRLQGNGLQWAIDLELSTKQTEERRMAWAAEAVETNRKRLAQLLSTRKPLPTELQYPKCK